MKIALRYAKRHKAPTIYKTERLAALAAALLHDLGHSPFSHLLEEGFGGSHINWTIKIISDPSSSIYQVLIKKDKNLPELVKQLLTELSGELTWISALLSSQIDVDRMDYLIRDSHFCGVSYGQFDFQWLFHNMRIEKIKPDGLSQPVWFEKATKAIEEYIFARYYMYWSVYYHRTTRGYEELLKAIFKRAKEIAISNHPLDSISVSIDKFVQGEKLSLEEYLSLDDSIIFAQLHQWKDSKDEILSDLCLRFLERRGLKHIYVDEEKIEFQKSIDDACMKIKKILNENGLNPEYYFLKNESVAQAYDYYYGEKEQEEQTARTSILIKTRNNEIKEISSIIGMGRLGFISGREERKIQYYVPEKYREKARKILKEI